MRKLIFTYYAFLQLSAILFTNSPVCGIYFIFFKIMLAWLRHKIQYWKKKPSLASNDLTLWNMYYYICFYWYFQYCKKGRTSIGHYNFHVSLIIVINYLFKYSYINGRIFLKGIYSEPEQSNINFELVGVYKKTQNSYQFYKIKNNELENTSI